MNCVAAERNGGPSAGREEWGGAHCSLGAPCSGSEPQRMQQLREKEKNRRRHAQERKEASGIIYS